MLRRWLTPILAILIFALPSAAQRSRLGIVGQTAPSWQGLQWLNLPQDVPALEVTDFRGKVIYVFSFQSWCPGCHSHGFPTLQEVEQHFREQNEEDVYFVAVQTVFEGFHTNTAARALQEVEDYGLEIPLAHSEGAEHGPSPFMRAYRTGGTPWTVLIGRDGKVAWNGYSIEPEQAIKAVEQLLLRPAPRASGSDGSTATRDSNP